MVRTWFVWVPYRVTVVHTRPVTVVHTRPITVVHEYEARREGCPRGCHRAPAPENTVTTAVNDVVSRGISMGKSAATQVKQFDEKHRLSATAIETASSVDQKLGISEKFNAGTSAINQQLRAVDERYQVSDKTKSTLVVAEKNVLIGASWVTGAVSKVAKAADDAVQKAKERATAGDVPQYVCEHGYTLVSTTQQPADVSFNTAATPCLYEYNPHGSLLRQRGFEADNRGNRFRENGPTEPIGRCRRKRFFWWVPCFGMGIP